MWAKQEAACTSFDPDNWKATPFTQLAAGDCSGSRSALVDPATWWKLHLHDMPTPLIVVDSATRLEQPTGGVVRLSYKGNFGERIGQYVTARLVADQLGFVLGVDGARKSHLDFAFQHAAPTAPAENAKLLQTLKKQEATGPTFGLHHLLLNKEPRLIHMSGLANREMWFFEMHAKTIKEQMLLPNVQGVDLAGPAASDVVVHLDGYPDCMKVQARSSVDDPFDGTALPVSFYEAALDSMRTADPWDNLWLVTRCGAHDAMGVHLMRKYGAKILVPPESYEEGSIKLLVHHLFFMMAAKRLILYPTAFSWWGGWLGNARELHYPLIDDWWGVEAMHRLYVNETRYIYHDLTVTTPNHGLNYLDIANHKWVKSSQDRFCMFEDCSKAFTEPGAEKQLKPLIWPSVTEAPAKTRTATALSAWRYNHNKIRRQWQIPLVDQPALGEKCPPVAEHKRSPANLHRAADHSTSFAAEIAHVQNAHAQELMREIGLSGLPTRVAMETHDSPEGRTDAHRLAIIVPYRDRPTDLEVFVPHMHKFLSKSGIDFTIIVVNQTGNHRFNRGQLINIGYELTKWTHDYLVAHDVDMYPVNPEIPYFIPDPSTAISLVGRFHPDHWNYRYVDFVGGALTIRHVDFLRAGGFPNTYWGWGGEDDAFATSLKKQNPVIKLSHIEDIICVDTGLETWAHDKCSERDETPDKDKKLERKLDKEAKEMNMKKTRTSFSAGQFTASHIGVEQIGNFPFVHVDVELGCAAEFKHLCAPHTCGEGEFVELRIPPKTGTLHSPADLNVDSTGKHVHGVKCNRISTPYHVCTRCKTECAIGEVLVGVCATQSGPKCLSAVSPLVWPAGAMQ
jgi:hypothetical protein